MQEKTTDFVADADLPAHLSSLISAFVIPSLESKIAKFITLKISIF